MAEQSKFTFFRSYWEALSELPDKDRLALYDAIAAYALNDTEPTLTKTQFAFFCLIKPNLDASRKKQANGKQGGSKPKANSKQTESKQQAKSSGASGLLTNSESDSESTGQANSKQPESDRERERDRDREKEYGIGNMETGIGSRDKEQEEDIGELTSPPSPSSATAYGTRANVFLTQREYALLVQDFGETNVTFALESLGKYLQTAEAQGINRDSHCALLRKKLWKSPTIPHELP